MLSTFAYSTTANFAYIVLPLFLFMGQMAFSASLSRHAFEAGQKWLGRIPGWFRRSDRVRLRGLFHHLRLECRDGLDHGARGVA
ncbi:MAG: hypothetical protein R3D67_21855 [Hyphomicrobiaceae bacterium]